MAQRYRLYPIVEQQAVLDRHGRDARLVWNAALEQLNHWGPGRASSPGHALRCRQLTDARREHEWLAAGSSSVQQQALRDFDRACRNWWAGTHRRPTWRKRGLHEGFCVRDTRVRKVNGKWAEIVVPKAGRVRLRLSRPLPVGEIGMARVTLDGKGRWHVSLPGPQPAVAREWTGAMVGVDRGVTATLATSDGRMLRAPVMRDRERARLKRLQRKLARQRKGSNRRKDTKHRIACLHQTVADRRRNWIEIQTTRLVREHDLIAVERLNVKGMVRRPAPRPATDQPGAFERNGAAAKAGLNRSIHAQAWSLWLQRVEQKAVASGVLVELVDARNTSRRCPACGHVAAENRKSQAVFHCVTCGHENNADINAAQNILARALNGLALTPGPGATTHDVRGTRTSHRPPQRRSANHPTETLPHAA